MAQRRPSTESSDSFEIISPPSSISSCNRASDDLSSDEDEIVWNVAESTPTEPVSSPLSDDEFVHLNAPLSPLSNNHAPVSNVTVTRYTLSEPSLVGEHSSPSREGSPASSTDTNTPPSTSPKKQRSRRGSTPVSQPTSSPGSSPSASKTPPSYQPCSPSKRKKKNREKRKQNSLLVTPVDGSPVGLGARSIVDDVSERGDDPGTNLYEEAVRYINCFLSDPIEHKAAHLALLQALIIELGFFTSPQTSEKQVTTNSTTKTGPRASSPTPSTASSFNLSDLPHSMRAAKSFIKANVFLNVREYIAVRAQGQEALQSVLHPNRRSLVTQLRKKSSRVPRGWVKERGLNVLLVSCH